MNTSKITGIIAAVPTPFTDKGTPDLRKFLKHARWALANGCDGLNVLGTTGEASSLSVAERSLVMAAAATSNIDTSRLMVGTGTPNLKDTIELTNFANTHGYSAALILPPYYFKPVTDEGLVRYFTEIFQALPNTNMGIYLYNFPQMTGLWFNEFIIEKLMQAFPGLIKGMKDSSGDLKYAAKIRDRFPDLDIFPSSETVLSLTGEDAFAGTISASLNLTAPIARRVFEKRDDLTDTDLSNTLQDLRAKIAGVPIVAAVKTLLAAQYNDSGWTNIKAPLVELTHEQAETLESVQDALQKYQQR